LTFQKKFDIFLTDISNFQTINTTILNKTTRTGGFDEELGFVLADGGDGGVPRLVGRAVGTKNIRPGPSGKKAPDHYR
jgi:hypothetical protein